MKHVYETEKTICNSDAFWSFQNYIYTKSRIISDLPLFYDYVPSVVYGEQSSHVYVKSTIRRYLK